VSRLLARVLAASGPTPVRPRLPTLFEPGLDLVSGPDREESTTSEADKSDTPAPAPAVVRPEYLVAAELAGEPRSIWRNIPNDPWSPPPPTPYPMPGESRAGDSVIPEASAASARRAARAPAGMSGSAVPARITGTARARPDPGFPAYSVRPADPAGLPPADPHAPGTADVALAPLAAPSSPGDAPAIPARGPAWVLAGPVIQPLPLHDRPAVAARPRRDAGRDSAEPTVRISIGRVEIRADRAEAPRPRRPAPRPRQPALDLAEYLRRRGGQR
jgi:hypothetical protein